MQRLLLAAFLFCFCLTATAFEDAAVSAEASQYRQTLRASQTQESADAALTKADRYLRQKLWEDAIAAYESAIAAGTDRATVWLDLSRAWQNSTRDTARGRERALHAAYNAYRAAQRPDEQARALFRLGDLYEKRERPKQALLAFKEGLGLEDNADIAKRYQALVEATAFRIEGVDVEANSSIPKICLRFSESLNKAKQIHYEDYLVIQPAIKPAVSVHAKQLCIEGVAHGQSYEITVRAGVPSAAGEKTRNAETFVSKVEDREPNLGFRGATYILPKTGAQNLPLTSVNVNSARIKLLRINDRNLTEQINERRITGALSGYDIQGIADRSGELLWEGKMDIASEKNQETTTGVPLNDILKNTQPGIYIVTAQSADKEKPRGAKEFEGKAVEDEDSYEERATQWVIVSDLGVATFKGQDGLHVFARSLDSAQPLAGVDVRLYARNNSELGKAVTDKTGYARFDPGLLRGGGGREPAALMVYAGGDFNFLDLTRPAFDLSDRGVDGREAPGPVDVFLYSERGVYRPGETVELMALARDSRGYALDKLPLTLKIIRPDEVESDRLTLTEPLLGGYHARLPMAPNARTGTWTVRAYTDPAAKPVGKLSFQVEDFVPQALKLELATQAAVLKPNEAALVDVNGRYLYGAPAANLKAEAELVLREDKDPYPAYPGYRFGLIQESWEAKRFPMDLTGTDPQGKAKVNVVLADMPDTTRPLQAVLRVSLFEPGGRPVNRTLNLPYRSRPFAIGIRPQFGDDGVPLGQEAVFSLLALDPQGQPAAVNGARYELYREDYEYYWYYRDNRWDYKLIIRDGQALEGREINLAADQPLTITQRNLDWGSYRLDVFDPRTGVASSVRFRVGWFATPGASADTPDQLKVTLAKPRYQAGETAQIRIKAPFAGEGLLTVASDKLWTARAFKLDAEGTTVELPVSADWSPGVYITATAFRPATNPGQRGPGRAVGVTWLELDQQPRTLAVNLAVPSELKPRQTFELPVTVTGAEAGKPTYLTVAAVDEGILQLTDFLSPDPLAFYLGKRRLGMELRDLYGKLIEPGGRPGPLRVGGDGESRQLDLGAVKTVKTVALFSGRVALDDKGQAKIPLALPDFNGQLRLMAVAWDQARLGKAETPLLVRDPLVAQLYLPRFLAPEDSAQITLNLQSLSAPAGDYKVNLKAGGAVALEDAAEFSLRVADASAQPTERKTYRLRGLTPGVGQLDLEISGPAGFSLSHQWEISVRPAQAIATERQSTRLEPGASLTVADALLKDYLPTTGQVKFSFFSRPSLDVPGLLEQVTRYPYGCAEQTTSTAFPLLYFNQVAQAWGAGDQTEAGLRDRVQGAIRRLLTMQRSEGSFGLWSPDSPAETWLSAYVMDFLGRARQDGYLVPEAAYRRGLDWLKETLAATETSGYALLSRAYALYVLARADQVPIGDLRYLHDNNLRELPTTLARAQLGAALARSGELNRAKEAFEAALQALPDTRGNWGGYDYGSALRDRAALVTLLTEAGVLTERIPQLAADLATDLGRQPYTSTQEQAWLLLAAHALMKEPAELRLSVDGREVTSQEKPFFWRPTLAEVEKGVTVVNRGDKPAWYARTTSGVPAKVQPAVQRGFTILRRYYDRSGKEVDPAQTRQNDLLVVVLTGEALTREENQALIVDLLPAGLEIENARLAHGQTTGEFAWLPTLSETLHTESRDDRFVAALDLDATKRTFAVAYLARAVTPGEYQLPAAFVEDMYKPRYHARGGVGTMKIR